MTKGTTATLYTMMCVAGVAAFDASASAQTPSSSITYDTIQAFVEPQIDAKIQADKRLDWGDEPHLTIGPWQDSLFNQNVAMHLNLKGHGDVVGIGVDAKIGVDILVYAQCANGHVNALLNGVTTTNDLPGIIKDFVTIDVPQASLQGFVDMANQFFGTITCGDVKAWNEGVEVFPPDRLDPFTNGSNPSICVDSTTGRSGSVSLQGNTIVAQIDPGVDQRWPDSMYGAELHVWVSADGTDGNSHELDATRVVDPDGQDNRMIESVGGQGLSATYALPDGMAFTACQVEAALSRSFGQ